MGLAASQARLLLLTAKNDALELAAQNIEQERLILAQEQETIAQEYSDKTTNQIYIARTIRNGQTQEETMTLETLALSQGSVGEGKKVVIADASGKAVVGAYSNNGTVIYFNPNSETFQSLSPDNSLVRQLRTNSNNSPLQVGIQNGSLRIMVENEEAQGTINLNTSYANNKDQYVRKSPESLDGVRSRYYTEDDAAAQAEYTAAMARVNALDTRLENKLNQIETQKKAVEQEMESVKKLVQSNVERTFKYFS